MICLAVSVSVSALFWLLLRGRQARIRSKVDVEAEAEPELLALVLRLQEAVFGPEGWRLLRFATTDLTVPVIWGVFVAIVVVVVLAGKKVVEVWAFPFPFDCDVLDELACGDCITVEALVSAAGLGGGRGCVRELPSRMVVSGVGNCLRAGTGGGSGRWAARTSMAGRAGRASGAGCAGRRCW